MRKLVQIIKGRFTPIHESKPPPNVEKSLPIGFFSKLIS